jgi:hypothetical protein
MLVVVVMLMVAAKLVAMLVAISRQCSFRIRGNAHGKFAEMEQQGSWQWLRQKSRHFGCCEILLRPFLKFCK